MTENERREFLKVAGASLAGVVGMGILGCGTSTTPDEISEARTLKRAELVERLKKLAESEPPKDLSFGAMCYEMAAPINKEMPCPKCTRTMKVGEKDEILSAYRVPLKRIQDLGVDAKLIVPEHCPECGFGLGDCGLTWNEREKLSPEDWKAKQFHLEIKYPDHPKVVRVELEGTSWFSRKAGSDSDIELIALFLQGKDRYSWGNDSESALKDKIDRLRELFGIEEQP